MICNVASGRACLRLGPTDAGSLVVWWPHGGRDGLSLLGGKPAVSGTLMASDARARAPRILETADVIFTAGGAGHAGPVEWLRRTLGRYPGCEVAVVCNRSGECTAATRDGWVPTLSLGGNKDANVCAFACAVFVQGWLAARLPVACLLPPHLEIGGGESFTVLSNKTLPGMLHFKFYYDGSSEDASKGDSAGGAISDSSSRMDSASGAPSFK